MRLKIFFINLGIHHEGLNGPMQLKYLNSQSFNMIWDLFEMILCKLMEKTDFKKFKH